MVKLSKIVLEVDGEEIELSIRDAKEVKRIIDSVLGVKGTHFIPNHPDLNSSFIPNY